MFRPMALNVGLTAMTIAYMLWHIYSCASNSWQIDIRLASHY